MKVGDECTVESYIQIPLQMLAWLRIEEIVDAIDDTVPENQSGTSYFASSCVLKVKKN